MTTNEISTMKGLSPTGWEEKSIGDLCQIFVGRDLKLENYSKEKAGPFNLPVYSNTVENEGLYGYYDFEEFSGESLTIVGRGAGLGTAFTRTGKYGAIGRLLVLFPKPNVCAHYITEYVNNKLNIHQESGGIPQLTGEQIASYKIIVPSYEEQKAIAHILGLMDTAINTNNQLIAQKELRKKWLMQQLLTGKKKLKRFEKSKWKIDSLEKLIKPVSREVNKPSEPYLGIGLRSHGKGTFLKPNEEPEKNVMDKFYIVRPNDLIVNITFAWEQAIAIAKESDDGALASHRFPTYTFIPDKGHPDFFRFFILLPRMKYMLQLISPGGAGRNRVMSKSDFLKLEFSFPRYEEQVAIASVLQAVDKEIQLLKIKTEKLREKKKGLMQVLLTGKVRIKIPAEV